MSQGNGPREPWQGNGPQQPQDPNEAPTMQVRIPRQGDAGSNQPHQGAQPLGQQSQGQYGGPQGGQPQGQQYGGQQQWSNPGQQAQPQQYGQQPGYPQGGQPYGANQPYGQQPQYGGPNAPATAVKSRGSSLAKIMAALMIVGGLLGLGFSFAPWIKMHVSTPGGSGSPSVTLDCSKSGIGSESHSVSSSDKQVEESAKSEGGKCFSGDSDSKSSSSSHIGTPRSDGWITLVGGIVAIAGGVLALLAKARIGGIIAAVGGLIVSIVAIVDWQDISDKAGKANDQLKAAKNSGLAASGIEGSVSVGWGIWLVLVGGLIALVGGVIAAIKGD